jgi:hypothetical protein
MTFLAKLPCPVRVGVDAHLPYLEQRPPDLPVIPLHLDIREAPKLFPDMSVDAVTLIDVIEHLEADDGERLLEELRRIARRRLVVFTPRGEFPQAGYDACDAGGEELQRHRSAWEFDDFKRLGFTCAVMRAFHGPWNPSFVHAFGAGAAPRDALLAWADSSPSN